MEQASNAQRTKAAPEVGRSIFKARAVVHLAIVLMAGLFIYGIWLGDSPLDRTEPFRALVAHQMVKGGSWLVPRLYGEVYLRKPPLIYWVEAIVEKLMGRGDEFVWRLPSAVGSALLAVFVAWWSGRWFGLRAVLPAGFACLALIALWDQDRGADIDALNTAFAVVSTACMLELLYGLGRRTPAWTTALGLSLGAMLLLKGPGGLPQVIAAMIGPAIVLRDFKSLRRRSIPILIGFVVGFAFFTAYIIAAQVEIKRSHIASDHTGWYEVIAKIFLRGWIDRLKALATPVVLMAFAMPVSLVLPFSIVAIRYFAKADPSRRRALAILGTLAAALVIWIVGANDNPRYEYVMLPLLAPLVGFVWQTWLQRVGFDLLRFGICAIFFGGFVFLFCKLPWSNTHHLLMIAGLVADALVFAALIALYKTSRELAAKAASPVVVILLLLFALPMAARKNAERQKKSAKNPAAQLRAVIGDAPRVSAAGVVRDLPELFYYANVDVDAYGEVGLPQLVAHRGHWIVISQGEKYPAYSTILRYIPNAFPRGITKLKMPDPRDQIYVGWYDPPAGADTRIEWKVEKSVEAED